MSDPKCLSVGLIMKELVMMISDASGAAASAQGHFPLKTHTAARAAIQPTDDSTHFCLQITTCTVECEIYPEQVAMVFRMNYVDIKVSLPKETLFNIKTYHTCLGNVCNGLRGLTASA